MKYNEGKSYDKNSHNMSGAVSSNGQSSLGDGHTVCIVGLLMLVL